MASNRTIVVIEAGDGTDRVLQFPAPSGGVATAVFETHEAADCFLRLLQRTEEWKIRGLTNYDAKSWLESLPTKGIDFVVPAPQAGEPLLEDEFLTIDSFLDKFYYV